MNVSFFVFALWKSLFIFKKILPLDVRCMENTMSSSIFPDQYEKDFAESMFKCRTTKAASILKMFRNARMDTRSIFCIFFPPRRQRALQLCRTTHSPKTRACLGRGVHSGRAYFQHQSLYSDRRANTTIKKSFATVFQ